MIRFRLGQRWRLEHESSLEDSFGLELDGIDLLPETSEESLAIVVPELVEAVAALSRGELLAQVSLPEAHLEIALWRRENEIEISVVDLGRPARVARGPVCVDLVDLSAAAVQCAKGLMQRVRDRSQLHSAPIQQMMRQVALLEHRRIAAAISTSATAGVQSSAAGAAPEFFRFDVRDSRNLIAAFGKGGRGPLASLRA